MNLREPCLPAGWYPREKRQIEAFLKPFLKAETTSHAVAAPHAGWYYSGLTAAIAVSSLDRDAETVIVIGGHLPSGAPFLAAEEEAVETPLGCMNIDTELLDAFKKQLPFRPDNYSDNTVEVLLPMVHYFFPRAKLLWLRFPAELSAFEAGKILGETAKMKGRRVVVAASTDLTHYGKNYSFSPKGSGKSALDWVKNVNDASFIGAVLEKDAHAVILSAEQNYSACSAGAILGALGFVHSETRKPQLLDYRTSADAGDSDDEEVPDSFVGYAAISLG